MKINQIGWVLLAIAALLPPVFTVAKKAQPTPPAWGFFGHRKINRQAVFTLPPDMLVFYKKHIEYLTEHAVDADNRRYASKHEAPRHFLDLDRYGEPPFTSLPRNWSDALLQEVQFFFVNKRGDTLSLLGSPVTAQTDSVGFHQSLTPSPVRIERNRFRQFFNRLVLPQYYEEAVWRIDCDSLAALLGVEKTNCREIFVVDTFSQHGILPYNLLQMQNRLTDAFVKRDAQRILRFSADIGHYIGDAHVPLHTTKNYNGQLTGQDGLHAFWESRLPELFADEQYDFWVGKADFIEQPSDYYWDIILKSHSLVDSVIAIEKSLRAEFPPDRQLCNEFRGNTVVRTQCADFAEAYHDRMGGMVENRLRDAILSVGSVWYTAWALAGQPDLTGLLGNEIPTVDSTDLQLQQAVKSGKQLGREHGQ